MTEEVMRQGFYVLKRKTREPIVVLWDGTTWWIEGEPTALAPRFILN